VLPACAHRAACPVQPWELLRRDAACLLVLYCHGHPVHRRCRGVAGIAKAVHRDAALAHRQDGPAARCSDEIVAVLRQPGACPAAHLDALALAHHQALWDATDSVAWLTVRQQDEEHLDLKPQGGHPQARFPMLQQAAAARQDAAQGLLAQRRDVRR
jgi:hypothetical protein